MNQGANLWAGKHKFTDSRKPGFTNPTVGSYVYYRVELIRVNRRESRARQRWDYLKCPPRGQREDRKGGREGE